MRGVLRRIIQNAWAAAERRRTARALLRLSDYLLTDVGLRRNDLERVVAGLCPSTDGDAMGHALVPIRVPQQALVRVRGPTMQGCG